jgi:hypothetical protein
MIRKGALGCTGSGADIADARRPHPLQRPCWRATDSGKR